MAYGFILRPKGDKRSSTEVFEDFASDVIIRLDTHGIRRLIPGYNLPVPNAKYCGKKNTL